MLANWPVTFFIIMPTNNRLMSLQPTSGADEARSLITRWGSLHAIRTGLSLAAVTLFSWALVSQPVLYPFAPRSTTRSWVQFSPYQLQA
jgi:uncharacterized membrane protein